MSSIYQENINFLSGNVAMKCFTDIYGKNNSNYNSTKDNSKTNQKQWLDL